MAFEARLRSMAEGKDILVHQTRKLQQKLRDVHRVKQMLGPQLVAAQQLVDDVRVQEDSLLLGDQGRDLGSGSGEIS